MKVKNQDINTPDTDIHYSEPALSDPNRGISHRTTNHVRRNYDGTVDTTQGSMQVDEVSMETTNTNFVVDTEEVVVKTTEPVKARGASQMKRQQPVRQSVQPSKQQVKTKPKSVVKPVNVQSPQTQYDVIKPKKKSNLPLILGICIGVLFAIVIAVLLVIKLTPKRVEQDYNTSGRYALDRLQSALNSYDAVAIDTAVGMTEGDSYLAQEWAYVNKVQLREEYIKKVCSLIVFTYPDVPVLTNKGTVLVDSNGNALTETSFMNTGESFSVRVPDYEKMLEVIQIDKDFIISLYKQSGYTPEEDYTFEEDLFNLFCQYMVDNVDIPMKDIEMALPLGLDYNNSPIVLDDALLDDALFGSDEFHKLCKEFSILAMEWKGTKIEYYTEKEEVHNEDYDAWYKVFKKVYDADNGRFNPRTSLWEPWYLRDENNVLILDENGEKIVNYYSVKDENGKDWIQPDETILVNVEKEREVPIDWVEETGIPYVMLGTNFLQNKYTGDYPTVFRVGDGSRDFPAGIGTSIVTKILCDDGKYHNVKVALLGYWTGQEAIDYAEGFSAKNRGFTTTSPVKLITFELEIENLEDKPITFERSEMTLCDANSNVSSRTGTLYGFFEDIMINGNASLIINDWASSTELQQKYVAWGETFDRDFPIVFFDALAGTGEISSYSAYEQFTGTSVVTEEDVNSQNYKKSTGTGGGYVE